MSDEKKNSTYGINELINQFDQQADIVKKNVTDILAKISIGKVPSDEGMAQFDTNLAMLKRYYNKVCTFAGQVLNKDEMPAQNSSVMEYSEAIARSQVYKQLDEEKALLTRFCFIKSKVKEYAEALKKYQNNAKILLEKLSLSTINELSASIEPARLFMAAFESKDLKDPQEIDLMSKVMNTFPAPVVMGLMGKCYYLPDIKEKQDEVEGDAKGIDNYKEDSEITDAGIDTDDQRDMVTKKNSAPIEVVCINESSCQTSSSKKQFGNMVLYEGTKGSAEKQRIVGAQNDEKMSDNNYQNDDEYDFDFSFVSTISQPVVDYNSRANKPFGWKKFKSWIASDPLAEIEADIIQKMAYDGRFTLDYVAAFENNYGATKAALETFKRRGYLRAYRIPDVPEYVFEATTCGYEMLRNKSIQDKFKLEGNVIVTDNNYLQSNDVIPPTSELINLILYGIAINDWYGGKDENFDKTEYINYLSLRGRKQVTTGSFAFIPNDKGEMKAPLYCSVCSNEVSDLASWQGFFIASLEINESKRIVVLGWNEEHAHGLAKFLYQNLKCNHLEKDYCIEYWSYGSEDKVKLTIDDDTEDNDEYINVTQTGQAEENVIEDDKEECTESTFTEGNTEDKQTCSSGTDFNMNDLELQHILDKSVAMINAHKLPCATTYLYAEAMHKPELASYYKELAYAVNDPLGKCIYSVDNMFEIYGEVNSLLEEYFQGSALLRTYFGPRKEFDYNLSRLSDAVNSNEIISRNNMLNNLLYSLKKFKKDEKVGFDKFADYRKPDQIVLEKKITNIVQRIRQKYDSDFVHRKPSRSYHYRMELTKKYILTQKRVFWENV